MISHRTKLGKKHNVCEKAAVSWRIQYDGRGSKDHGKCMHTYICMHKCDTKTEKRSPILNSCAILLMSNNHLLNCYSVATLELQKKINKLSRRGHSRKHVDYVFCYSSAIYLYLTTYVKKYVWDCQRRWIKLNHVCLVKDRIEHYPAWQDVLKPEAMR